MQVITVSLDLAKNALQSYVRRCKASGEPGVATRVAARRFADWLAHAWRDRAGQSPQSNGIVERLHRTLLDEHFSVEGRRTWFENIEEVQAVLDCFLVAYNCASEHPSVYVIEEKRFC